MKQSKNGFISVIAVIFISAFMLIGVFSMNVYVYIESYNKINNDINFLEDVIQKCGGLPQTEYDKFNQNIKKYPFIKNENDIGIEVKTNDGRNCIGTAELDDESSWYVSNKDNEYIKLKVTVPSNTTYSFLKIINLFGLTRVPNNYVYQRDIISKREIPQEENENESENKTINTNEEAETLTETPTANSNSSENNSGSSENIPN